ncbi:hypothetical protein B0H14DRAFT_2590617 [Mycena olivaceomarginata]|nr:hypothetical protein B0H14DRAFT_2590617 [Mycena olivaceomarginata]
MHASEKQTTARLPEARQSRYWSHYLRPIKNIRDKLKIQDPRVDKKWPVATGFPRNLMAARNAYSSFICNRGNESLSGCLKTWERKRSGRDSNVKITSQPALVFGLQDELLNPCISSHSWAWVIIRSSNLNSSADVLDTAYAFTDLVGELVTVIRGRKLTRKGAAFGPQKEPERGVADAMAGNEGNNREDNGIYAVLSPHMISIVNAGCAGLRISVLRITLVKHWFPVGIYSRDLNPLGRPTLSWVNGTNKAGLCRFPDWAGIRRTESADPSAL